MPEASPIWATLTPDEHEFQYNPQAAFPDFDLARRRREPANAEALTMLERHADIAFGDHPLRTLDVYPAGEGAPVHVFLHGGYWRAQDKANFAFVAGALVPHGITTVVANYELCPAATLDGVVDSALAAMRWVRRTIARHGGDPARITLSGHSAGAHLGAEILAHDWGAEGLPLDVVAGAVLTSGIFDPAPARLTSVNAELDLTEEIVARRNVMARPPVVTCPVALLVGGLEPWQWIDQTYRYFQHLYRHDRRPGMQIIAGRGHFDILDEYLDGDSATMRAILGQVRAASAAAAA